MAERGRRLDAGIQARIRRMVQHVPVKRLAREIGVSKNTVKKYRDKPIEV